MISVHRDGFIRGGCFHERLHLRKCREQGARLAWVDAEKQGCVQESRGWLRMVKPVKRRRIGDYGGGNAEIGYWRATAVVFNKFIRFRKAFRRRWMEKWLKNVAALEFDPRKGFTNPSKYENAMYIKGHATSYKEEFMKRLPS